MAKTAHIELNYDTILYFSGELVKFIYFINLVFYSDKMRTPAL